MSYPSFQGYSGDYGPSSNDQSSAYGASRSSSAVAPASANPAYPVSSSQQQYGSTAYSWPYRNQTSYGNINGNTQNYGSTGWKDGQAQQPMHDYQRSQTTYAPSSTTNHINHGWYAANRQPQAQSSTQALNSLAYASGLDAQEQQGRNDRRSAHGHPGSQHLNTVQREGCGQERLKSPSYGPVYVSSNIESFQASQAEQSPTSSHQNLTVSAAAAFTGAVNRRYSTSPTQQNVSHQQDQRPASSFANAATQSPLDTVPSQHRQRPPSSHDTDARGQPHSQSQPASSTRAQPSHNLNRYETTENHRYTHSSNPNVILPLPSGTRGLQPKPVYGATQRPSQKNADTGRSSDGPRTGTLGITASNCVQPSSGFSRQQNHEPSTAMPTFIDPSQVFNPYHKEHERQKREEAERAKRASIEASEPNTDKKASEASTDQSVKAVTTTAPASQLQTPRLASTDLGIKQPSQSSPIMLESEESEDVDMASEMKAMMHRMRGWKTKDPSLFQKLWDDMKKGGSNTQPTKGQTPRQSPQLAQVVPQPSPPSQSSQPSNTQTVPAPQTLSQTHPSSSRTAPKTSPKAKRHWDLTMVVESNEKGLPDLGRFPAERRNRRTTQEVAEAKVRRNKARRIEAKGSAQTPPIISSQSTAQTKKDETLIWPIQTTSQPPPATNEVPGPIPTQTLPPISPNGGTIWPEAKRKALAEAAQKALIGLTANNDKSITAAEINALLEQNPSYTELCARLEARGFIFHRGQFARFLLNTIPDLTSPSQAANKTSEPTTPSASLLVPPPKQTVPNRVAAPLPIPSGSIQNAYPPAQSSSHINYRLQPAPPSRTATPIRPQKHRLGVPSSNIPTPIPGSKEAKARKRDFSELVDLTQLSDDEDYVMPRKHARQATPEREQSQLKSNISLPNAARPMSDMQRNPYSFSNQPPFGPPGGTAPLKFDPQAQRLAPQLQSHAPAQSSQAAPQKSRHLLAKPLNKAEALRKSYYDPKTVARDILIAAGRHPGEHPLNSHLAGLLGKHIDIDSDLSTFDWDTVDPGGPPMPVVQVVDIPAGPPRWKFGQRARARSPAMGTFDPPPRVRADGGVNLLGTPTIASKGIPESRIAKDTRREKLVGSHAPDVQSSLARLSSQTKSLLEDSFKKQNPSHQPTRLRQSQNVDEDSKTPSQASSLKETTPHPTKSITPIILNSTSSHHSQGRISGGPRKTSIMDEPPSEPVTRRRGRPPGSRNKDYYASMVKKAATSIPALGRSPSPPQYNVYACQWQKCDAKLHNLPTLRKHIARVHRVGDDELKSEGQPCWWKQCRTLEAKGGEIVPQVTFTSTSDWLEHIKSDHLHHLGMKLGDGPSSAQTGKPKTSFEVSKYFYHPPSHIMNPVSKARTCSHTDPQTIARDRQIYLSDEQGRAVTAPSTKTSIADYASDTLALSSVTMNPESNIPNRAFSKAHGNEKMEIRQSAIETLVALQRHKERVGPGLDRGGCTLVNAERRAAFMDQEGMMRVVDADY